MNISMRLTLDGMLRALRWRAHTAAEEPVTIRGGGNLPRGRQSVGKRPSPKLPRERAYEQRRR